MTSPSSRQGSPRSSSDSPTTSRIRRNRPSYSCENCRSRRVKCNQARPRCGSCLHMNIDCRYPTPQEKRPKQKVHTKSNASHEKTEAPKLPYLNSGYLSIQPGGRSRFIGSNFWASADLDVLEIDSLCYELPLIQHDSSCHTLDRYGRSTSPTSCHNNWRDLTTILLALPLKDVCDGMYANFVSSVHPLIPLLHLPSFDQQYIRFWDWYQGWNTTDIPEGVLAETPSFLSLMVSVLYAGSLVSPSNDFSQSMSSAQMSNLQSNLYRLTSQSLGMVGFPQNPSISSLQAYLLFNSLQIREEEALSSCSFVAVAFRMAQAMGLHRDGTDFNLEPIEVETRRRLWWYIMHLDVMSSLISGLPLVASLDSSNTSMLSEINDERIGDIHLDTDDTSNLSPSYVLTIGRYEASSVIRQILQTIISPQKYNATQLATFLKTIKQLSLRTESRINKLLLMQCSDHLKSWSANLLRLMVDRAYCLVYFPLLRDEAIWSKLRAEAIPSFQSMLRIFIRMSTNQSYKPFHWLYPGNYQPLQAVSVLLVDMLHHPTASETAESRRLINSIFSLIGPDGRVSASGSDAGSHISPRDVWQRLENLRRKVWAKMGLDYSIHWNQSFERPTESNGIVADIAYDEITKNPQLISAEVAQENILMGFGNAETGDVLSSQPQYGFSTTNFDVQAVLGTPDFDFSVYLEGYGQSELPSFIW